MKHTTEKELQVIELYKQGIEIKKICKLLNVHKDYPSQVAKKLGISRGSGRKSEINPDLFSLGSPSSEYWIGYIIADGNLNSNSRHKTIMIASMDLEIKDKFLSYSGANYHLRKNGLHTMYFGSGEIFDNLVELGIKPKKSSTIELNFDLTFHILRGIFDGDGSVHNKRFCCKITTGSEILGKQIVEFLRTNDIYSKLRRRLNTDHFDVWIERTKDYIKFFNNLYKDADSNIKLDRKYNKFVALISNNHDKLDKIGESCKANTEVNN